WREAASGWAEGRVQQNAPISAAGWLPQDNASQLNPTPGCVGALLSRADTTRLQSLSGMQYGRGAEHRHSALGTSPPWHCRCGDEGPMRALPWLITTGCVAMASMALAAQTGCPPDSVAVGPICVDKYEASIWQVSPNSSLVKKIQRGKVTLADLTAGGAIQLS